jgi:hypothetical protein
MTSDRAGYGAKAPPFEVQADGTDLYAVFHGVRIAKRGANGTPQARTWISLEPGYRVRVQRARRPYHRRGVLVRAGAVSCWARGRLQGNGVVVGAGSTIRRRSDPRISYRGGVEL